MRLRATEHLLLAFDPRLSKLGEPGGNDDGSLGTADPELADQAGHLIGRCGDAGEIRCLGQARHVRMDLQSVQAGMRWIDQIEPSLKADSPRVAKGDGSHRART